jgi:hypothetical protein
MSKAKDSVEDLRYLLTVDDENTFTADQSHADSVKAKFGDSDDLQIYHDGVNSYIWDVGVGNLNLVSTAAQIALITNNKYSFIGQANGGSYVYYDGAAKLYTTSTGINVTGTITADGLSNSSSLDITVPETAGAAINMEFGDASNTTRRTVQFYKDALWPSAADTTTINLGGPSNQFNNAYFSGTVTAGGLVVDGGDSILCSDGSVAGVGGTLANGIYKANGSESLVLRSNSAERVRIDSSGNVGIDATPDAWASYWTALDIGTGGSLSSNTSGQTSTRTFVTDNAYNAGSSHATTWKYKITAAASQHEQIDGKHVFRVALSGSAGAAIGWNDAMTVDNSGNVGINSSSPTEALEVFADDVQLKLRDTSAYAAGTGPTIGFQGYDSSSSVRHFAEIKGVSVSSDNGALTFATRNAGTTAEAMRIDSSGNVLVGTTSTTVYNNTSGGGVVLGGAVEMTRQEAPVLLIGRNTSTGNAVQFYYGSAEVGSISVTGSATAYNTSSDYRLKELDVPMTGATERVKALRPINFAWKADGSRVDGFFAHELAEVVPEAATGTKDAMMDEEYEVSAATGDVFTAGVEGVDAVYETVTVSAAIEAQDAVMSERNVTETIETGSYVNLAGETIVETKEQTVTTDVVETVVQRQDIDGISTEVEVEVTKQVPVTESYESAPAVEAVAEVTEQRLVSEGVTAIAEVIHSADVEQPETLEEGQQWRETTAQVMATRSVPDMQGIDQAKLVPLLTATIQELIARIEILEA